MFFAAGIGQALQMQQAALDVAGLGGRQMKVRHEPDALPGKEQQQQQGDDLRDSNARAEGGQRHELLL